MLHSTNLCNKQSVYANERCIVHDVFHIDHGMQVITGTPVGIIKAVSKIKRRIKKAAAAAINDLIAALKTTDHSWIQKTKRYQSSR